MLKEIEALGNHHGYRVAKCVSRRRWQSPSPDSLRQLGARSAEGVEELGGDILKLCVKGGGAAFPENTALVPISDVTCQRCFLH